MAQWISIEEAAAKYGFETEYIWVLIEMREITVDYERPGAQQGTHEPGYAHRVGLHRRRRPDGRSGSDPEIRRRGLEIHAVEQFERSLVGRSGHVSGAYHLFRRTFAPR